MPEVRADLVLDATEALSTVDNVGSALGDSLDSAAARFQSALEDAFGAISTGTGAIDIPVSVDTTAAVDALDALPSDVGTIDVPVDANTDAAVSAIDELPAHVETIDIPVDDSQVDEATAKVGDLGDATVEAGGKAEGAGGSFGAMGGHLEDVAGVSDFATQGVSALGGGSAEMGIQAAGAAVGLGAFTGGALELFHSALDAEGAQARWAGTLGFFRNAVDELPPILANYGSNVQDLGVKLGVTSTETQNAETRSFKLAEGLGFNGLQAAEYSNHLTTMAQVLQASNPALGDMDSIITRLSRGMTGNVNLLAKMGVQVDKNEVATRMYTDAASGLSAGLDPTQAKAVATMEVAWEHFSGKMPGLVDQALKNPQVQAKETEAKFKDMIATLGKPLVSPLLNLMKDPTFMSALKDFGKAFAELTVAVLPLLPPLIRAITPILKQLADIMGSDAFKTASKIFADIAAAMLKWNPLVGGITALINVLSVLRDLLPTVGNAFTTAGIAVANFFKTVAETIKNGLDQIVDFFKALGSAILSALETAFDAVINFFEGVPGKILAALAALPLLLVGLAAAAVTGFLGAFIAIVGAAAGIAGDLIGTVVGVVTGLIGDLAGIAGSAVSSFVGALGSIVGSAAGVISSMVDACISAASSLVSGLAGIAASAAGAFVNALTSGISSAAGAVASAVGSVISAAKDAIGGAAGSVLSHIPGLMAGGAALPGSVNLVGEAGPELLIMGDQGGFVIPNAPTQQILGQAETAPSVFNLAIDARGATSEAVRGLRDMDWRRVKEILHAGGTEGMSRRFLGGRGG